MIVRDATATHEKKAELLKAELSNALNLEAPENTPAPNAPKRADVEKVEATPPAELESPFKRKKIPVDCEKAYQKHQDTLKKARDLKVVEEKWKANYDALLAHEPTRTQRLFSKIGLGTAKIERYDLELAQATKALSAIEHNRTVYQKILGNKNSLALVEHYNAVIDHNAKISKYEAQAKIKHAAKLERERELAEEQARQLSEPYQDWTVDCDPTRNQEKYVSTSNDLSL